MYKGCTVSLCKTPDPQPAKFLSLIFHVLFHYRDALCICIHVCMKLFPHIHSIILFCILVCYLLACLYFTPQGFSGFMLQYLECCILLITEYFIACMSPRILNRAHTDGYLGDLQSFALTNNAMYKSFHTCLAIICKINS